VVSACCSVADDVAVARRRAAGLVGFYASVRTYADFFAFHDLAADQRAVIETFRSGAPSDELGGSVSPAMVDALTMTGTRDDVATRVAAYEGIADAVKLSPPTHGLPAAETRAAQEEIIALIGELTGGRG
jgi:Luciferase-like monooxygenase